jgi:hypothetical protein
MFQTAEPVCLRVQKDDLEEHEEPKRERLVCGLLRMSRMWQPHHVEPQPIHYALYSVVYKHEHQY